jgi:small conductance mechanosensitive channel
MMFTIGYRDDLDTAKKAIAEVLENDSRILKQPAPLIAVAELVGNSNMKLAVRPWTKADDYWDVWFDVTEKIKRSFDANGINGKTPVPIVIQKED